MAVIAPERTEFGTEFAEVAERTLAVLEERGWCHQGAHGENGEVCLIVSITLACGKQFKDFRAALQHRLQGRISEWNDAPERTYEDVVALLESFR